MQSLMFGKGLRFRALIIATSGLAKTDDGALSTARSDAFSTCRGVAIMLGTISVNSANL